MHLLAGDQLWDRYRVERVTGSGWTGAWLSPLRANSAAAACLLVPLEPPAPHALAAFLAAVNGALTPSPAISGVAPSSRKEPARAPRESPANISNSELQAVGTGAAPLRKTAVFGRKSHPHSEDAGNPALTILPFVGGVEWIGEPRQRALAVLAAAAGQPLDLFLRTAGPLTPAQALPLGIRLAETLDAFLKLFDSAAPPENVLRATVRVLHPGALILQSADARLQLRAALPESAGEDAPAWMAFAAPEVFSAGKVSASACVFSLARILATCLLPRSASPAGPAANWLALTRWAAGARDAAAEFNEQAEASAVPKELREILAKSLAQKTTARPETPGKFAKALQALADLPWARPAALCLACGFPLNPGNPCPCCGRQGPLLSATAARPRKGSAVLAAPTPASTGGLKVAPNVPEGMTLIPGGPFLSGERKTPRNLRTFAIDTVPVSESDYKKFLAAAGKSPRRGGPGSRPAQSDGFPVCGITWFEANAYAEHHGKRLPTLYEWEKAARGVDGRKFPYGNTYRADAGNLRLRTEGVSQDDGDDVEPAASPVGTFKHGASPYGVLDMCGNVLEWTSSARRSGERLFRAVKGACFLDGSPELARCTSIQYLQGDTAAPHLGFRCVKDAD